MVRSRLTLLALVLALGACAGPTATTEQRPAAAPELARLNHLLADLAERLKPAIVHVRVRSETGESEESEGPREPRRSAGSGFVISPDGLMVTNAHVVQGADRVEVRLHDGRRFTGKVIGRDGRTDLAVLKVDGVAGLPTLPFADSNSVRVGELVLALGHPFGLEHTVSFGIVGRKGAPLAAAAPGFDFIQTDAAVNPGNSGGPLVNMAGEVVGVNSMAARNGSIGFAIPANLVKTLVPQLVAKGQVEWGWLGVMISEVSEDELARLKLQDPRGVLIRSVMPGEPADQGGLKADDVIVAFDGERLTGPRDLQRVVALTPVGKTVRVTVVREGRETSLDVKVGRWKEPEERGQP